jgi:isopenicillin N synthase-like dioxygenase
MSGLSGFRSVPTVDVSGLRGDDAARAAVAAQLRSAAETVGFLYVSGSDVPEELFPRLVQVTEAFFALPEAAKMALYIGRSTNHRGYVPPGEEVFAGGTADRKEGYDLSADLPADDPDYVAGNPLIGPNVWPDLPGFREAVTAYYDAVLGFGRELLQGFALAMGQPADALDHLVRKPTSQLRLLHYPHDATATDAVGIGAHTDYELFTLLRPTTPGLEVLNGAGEWIDVPPVPGAFVVNIGDLFEVLTNGRFVATTHRVRTVPDERYAFPLFFALDYDAEVAPLPDFVGEGEVPRAPIRAGEHLFAQTAQSFSYLKERLAAGEIALPDGAAGLSSFGRDPVGSAAGTG